MFSSQFALTFMFPLLLGVANFSLTSEDPPTIMGIDLSKYPHASHPKDQPDLYELDPNDTEGRYRRRKAVYEIPIGESWLRFPVDKPCFYIEPRETVNGAISLAGRTYGPISGDPFETLGLIKLMSDRICTHNNLDDLYRIRIMLRTGDKKMAERANTLLNAALSEKEEPYKIEGSLHAIAEIIADHQELFKEHGLDAKTQQLTERIATIRQTIESLSRAFPNDQYKKGSEVTQLVPKEIPKSAWGATNHGLRTAIVLKKPAAKVGEQIEVLLVVENVTDQPIKFSFSDLTQQARATIERTNQRAEGVNNHARKVDTKTTWFTGLCPLDRLLVQPGEQIVLVSPNVCFVNTADKVTSVFGTTNALAGVGSFEIAYEISFGQSSSWSVGSEGVMRRDSPAKGEWSGELTTGKALVTIAE